MAAEGTQCFHATFHRGVHYAYGGGVQVEWRSDMLHNVEKCMPRK